jgi:hypothetical protein
MDRIIEHECGRLERQPVLGAVFRRLIGSQIQRNAASLVATNMELPR